MLLSKLKLAFGTMAVLLVFGLGGVVYQGSFTPVSAQPGLGLEKGKPLTEVEALRKELELTKLNLQVVLEKVRDQEAQLQALRNKPAIAE